LRWGLIVLGCIGILLFAAGFFFFRKRGSEEADKVAVELTLLEDRFLEKIKEGVDLQSPDTVAAFSTLAKLFRNYLSDRYHIPVPEVSAKEVGAEMQRLGVSEKTVEQTQEVLRAADVARFSGGRVERSVLERATTLVEDILTRNRRDFIAYSNSITGNND
jgi:hypothetical protein